MASANEITARLLIRIPQLYPNVRAWRNNRVDAMAVSGGRLRKISAGVDGQGDILGIIGPSGRMLQIEIKAGRDRMRTTQLAFQHMVEQCGGLYLIARDVDQCLADLDREINTMSQKDYIQILFDQLGYDTSAQRRGWLKLRFNVEYVDDLGVPDRSRAIDMLKEERDA